MAGLHFDITGDNSNFMRKLEETRSGVRNTSKQIEESGLSIEQMFGRITSAAAAFGAGFTAKELIGSITRVRGEFQQLEVAFKTMLGSEEQANVLMSQLVNTAAKTPFDLQGVANGAKQLLAYGTSAEDVNGTLVRLGDIAAGLSIPLNDLVYLYGTTMTQGRLFTQDLRQFQGRGIPLADELAKQFGVAKDKVGELVTAGKVGFPEVQKAIEAMTNDGGKFGGLMESQSKTITGQISNIEDAISTMFNKIGKENESTINSALSSVSYLVEHWESVVVAIESAAVAYGTYKAAVMTTAALQGAEQTLKVDTEIEGLKALLVVKEESKNADIAAAVSSGNLTEAKASELVMLREELATRLSVLKVKEEEAIAEQASALSAFNTAKQASDAANEKLEKMNALYEAALAQGDTSYEQYAIEQLQTASANANTAATTLNTAERNLNAASSKRMAASEAVGTVATQANTIANHANTASMNIMKLAAIQLTTILKGMWATLMANPLLLVAGAVAGLGFALYKVATAENEAEKAARMYNEALDEQQKKQDEYKENIDKLIKAIGDNNKSEGERLQAFEALKAEYPTVLNNLLTEAEYLKDVLKYKKLIAEEDNNRAKKSDTEILEEEKRKLEYYQNVRKNGTSTSLVDMDGNGWASDNVEKAIKEQQAIVNKAIAKVAEHDVTSYLGNIKNINDSDIISVINGIDTSLKAIGKSGDDAIAIVAELGGEFSKSQLSSIKSALETEQKSRSGEKNTGKGWIEKYKKGYLDAKKNLDAFLNAESSMSETEYERKLKELTDKKDEAEKKYKSVGGVTNTSKQESAAEKLRKQQEEYNLLIDKHKLSQIRAEEDAANEMERLAIERLREGSEKVLRQRKLNHKQELEAIKREAEDNRRKVIEEGRTDFEKNPENKGKSFNADKFIKSEPVKKQFIFIDNVAQEKTKTENVKYNRGDDLSSLLNEYQDYTDKRLSIEKKYNDDIATLEEQRKIAVKNEDTKQVEQIDRAKAQADKIRKEALSNISKNEIEESGIWKKLMGELNSIPTDALEELLSDAEQLVKVSNLSAVEMQAMMKTINEARQNLVSRNPFKTLKEEYEKYRKALKERDKDGAAASWSNVNKATEEIKSNISSLGSSLSGLAGTFSEDISNGIQKTVSLINDGISAFEYFGKKGEKSAGDTIKGISGIIGIVTTLIGTLLDAFDNSKELQERNMEYQRRQEGYWESINYQTERYLKLLEQAAGNDYFSISANTLKKIEGARDKAHKDIVASMPVGDVDRTTFGLAQLLNNGKFTNDMLANFGGAKTAKEIYDFINANGGYDLENKLISEDAIWAMKNNADIWSKLPSWMQDAIDKFVEYNQQAEELEEKLNSDLFQTTSKSIEDAILNGLKGGKKGIEDFGEDFEEIMRNALLQSFVIEQLRGKAQEFYKKYTQLADSDGDKKLDLTAEEIKDLRDDWNAIISAASAEKDKIDKITGSDSSSSSQDSTKGGFQSMSQDTGEELNGRFTALQISNEEIKNSMLSMLVCVNLISVTTNNNNMVLVEIKNLMVSSNSYLEDIAKYTKELIGFKQIILNIENSTKSMTGK